MMRGDRLDDIIGFAQTPASEENRMSIFPTKILLAADGSREAELAAGTAADHANSTNSELHLITVARVNPVPAYYTHEVVLRYETYEEAL
jgi:hypothetical protein